jgi:hypothetical protein
VPLEDFAAEAEIAGRLRIDAAMTVTAVVNAAAKCDAHCDRSAALRRRIRDIFEEYLFGKQRAAPKGGPLSA